MSRTPHFFNMPPELFHGKIPFPVVSLIKELRSRGAVDVEGIFRLNGSDTRTKELIDELDSGPKVNLRNYTDIHVIATALKRYFRTMSDMDPLIPNECFNCLITMMSMKDDPTHMIAVVRAFLTETMPQGRFRLLGYFFQFLYEVSKNSEKNLMTPSNLAVCIAPNVIGRDDDSAQFQSSMKATRAVEFLISYFPELFPDFAPNMSWFCTEQEINEACVPPLNVACIQQQIVKIGLRKNRVIPYVPICRYSSKPVYKRPKRKAPPRPENDTEAVVNMFDSFISRVGMQSKVSNLLQGARKSFVTMDNSQFEAAAEMAVADLEAEKSAAKGRKVICPIRPIGPKPMAPAAPAAPAPAPEEPQYTAPTGLVVVRNARKGRGGRRPPTVRTEE